MAIRVGPIATKSSTATKTITFKKGTVAKPSQSITIAPKASSIIQSTVSKPKTILASQKNLKPLANATPKSSTSTVAKADPVLSAVVAASNARTTITPKTGLNPVIPSGNVNIFRVAQAATAAQHGPNYSQQQYFDTLQKIKTQSDTIPLKSAVKIMDNAISTKKSLDNLSAAMKTQVGTPFSNSLPTPTKTIQFKSQTVLSATESIKSQIAAKKSETPILKPSTTKYQVSPAIKAAVAAQIAQKAANTPEITITPIKFEPTLKTLAASQKAKEQKTQFIENPLKLNTYTVEVQPKLKIMTVSSKNPGLMEVSDKGDIKFTKLKDYSLLKTTYGSSTTNKLPLEDWSKTEANPVRDAQYIENVFQCVQFSIAFVKASRQAGYDTFVVSVKELDGSGHAMVGLRKGDRIYQYDPLGNLDILNPDSWYASPTAVIGPSSFIKDTQKFIDFVKPMSTIPNLIKVNETINQKIQSGEFTIQPIQVTIPIVDIYEPQDAFELPTTPETVESADIPTQYNMNIASVAVLPEPKSNSLESYPPDKYPALLSDSVE
jgi:hypothetical protein